MAGVRIGDEECPIEELLGVFKKEDAEQKLLGKPPMVNQLMDLGEYLEIPADIIDGFKSQIQQGERECYEIIHEIFVYCRASNTDVATLGPLLSIVENKFKWKCVTEFLRNKIQSQAINVMDLDEGSRNQFLDHDILFLGRQTCLRSLQNSVSQETFNKILNEVDNKIIVGILQSNMMFDDLDLPAEPQYYTSRSIEVKRKLNPDIFQKACEDIFIFENTLQQDQDLSTIVRPNTADVSGGQLKSLTVRFMLLEAEEHLLKIVNSTNKPIHRIQYQDGSLFWIRTYGSLGVIREFLSDEVEEISEDNLINEILSDPGSKPLAVCGGSGTGKSVLLASLANKIFQKFPERYAFFLNFPNMIRKQTFSATFDDPKELVNDKSRQTKALAELIGSVFIMDSFARIILEALINKESTQFEIFLDRFDEIPFEQVGDAMKFLLVLLKYPNIRIYLTFGPTVRQELENCLQIISCNISPLSKKEMEYFLSKKVDSQICQMVLKSVDLLGKNEDLHKETAGSPLQCKMLAEVYSNKSGEKNWIKSPIKSLTQLYSEYMEIKFQQKGQQDTNLLKLLYYRDAINKLFFGNNNAEPILEALDNKVNQFTPTKKSCKSDFEHKTFSEYLLAKFIVENLKEHTSPIVERTTLHKFVYRTLLTTCKAEESDTFPVIFNDDENDTLESFLLKMETGNKIGNDDSLAQLIHLGWDRTLKYLQLSVLKGQIAYRHSATCYFLNAIISNDSEMVLESNKKCHFTVCPNLLSKSPEFKKISKDFISKILIAVGFSYKHLFQLATDIYRETTGENEMYIDSQTCVTILILAARQDDVETFKYFRRLVESNWGTKMTSIIFHSENLKNLVYEHTPLHEAVKRGSFELSEYLLNVYKDKIHSMSGLFQVCLSDSRRNFQQVIKNKVKILRLLSSENIVYNFKSLESSLLDGVHVTLFTKICDIIGYVLSKKDLKCLYRFVVYYFTYKEQMDILVNWLISKDLTRLLFCIYESKKSLLVDALRQNILSPKTLDNIYTTQKFEISSLWSVVTNCKKWLALVKKIIDLTGDVNLVDAEDRTILHWAAYHHNIDLIKYLLVEGSDRTCRDRRNQIPQELIFRNKKPYPKSATKKEACEKLLLTDTKIIMKETSSCNDNRKLEKIQYDSKRVLGRGQYGIVFSGKLNEKMVAVKKIVYKSEQEQHLSQETNLLLECDAHENIIKCFDVQKLSYTTLIAFEICNFTLEEWVNICNKTNDDVQARRILYQTAHGLEFLHSKDVVHLDITPQNILLIPIFNDDIKVRISDFGNSRKLSADNPSTKIESGPGTVEWMAPEVIKMASGHDESSSQKLSTAADIFSLGCVFYFVLSKGKHPFGDNEEDIQLNLHCNNPRVNFRHFSEPTFIHLYFVMTNQNPEHRPKAAAILKHHIFWPENNMLNFLVAVSNAADQPEETSTISNLMTKIENYSLLNPYHDPPNSKGWIRFLCPEVQKYVSGIGCKRKAYEGDLLFDLLRAIRNMQGHFAALPANVQSAVGEVPKSFVRYWVKRFAVIFEVIWLHFEIIKDEPSSGLSDYYSRIYHFNCKEISERAEKILAQYVKKQCAEMVLRGNIF